MDSTPVQTTSSPVAVASSNHAASSENEELLMPTLSPSTKDARPISTVLQQRQHEAIHRDLQLTDANPNEEMTIMNSSAVSKFTSHDDETLVSSPSITSYAPQSPSPTERSRFAQGVKRMTCWSVHDEDVPEEEQQKIRIEAMYNKISHGVSCNFNYASLLVIASIVAAMGLTTGSTATVISSMLLSPIMGPVIGISYGVIIWDKPLIFRGLRNEFLSVLTCWVLGFLIAATTYWTTMAEPWPTSEMYSRGNKTSMLAGLPVAFVSGMGVAFSILDDNVSGVVGAAISASLLPPAVNSGILCFTAAIHWHPRTLKDSEIDQLFNGGLVGGDYHPKLSMAITSLFLTISNVILVALGAILMFRIKEIIPVKKNELWTDLKMARTMKYHGTDNEENGGAGERALAVEGEGADGSHSRNEKQHHPTQSDLRSLSDEIDRLLKRIDDVREIISPKEKQQHLHPSLEIREVSANDEKNV